MSVQDEPCVQITLTEYQTLKMQVRYWELLAKMRETQLADLAHEIRTAEEEA